MYVYIYSIYNSLHYICIYIDIIRGRESETVSIIYGTEYFIYRVIWHHIKINAMKKYFKPHQ